MFDRQDPRRGAPRQRFDRRRFIALSGASIAALAVPRVAPAVEVDRDTPFGARLVVLNAPIDAPNLPLLRPDDSVTRMNGHPGEVVLAVFWATWCHVCHKEMPRIDAVAPALAADGVRVLPISLDAGDGALDKVAAYYERRGIVNLEPMIDADRLNAGAVGIRGTPTSFIIDKNAQIVAAIEGEAFFDSDEALRYLRHLAST